MKKAHEPRLSVRGIAAARFVQASVALCLTKCRLLGGKPPKTPICGVLKKHAAYILKNELALLSYSTRRGAYFICEGGFKNV